MIKIQNIDDNECFKWSLIRYLCLEDYDPEIIIKTDKNFPKRLILKA